jgi:Flp pilus assembly pilin Flp
MDLFVLKTWLHARLDVRSERGANLVEYVLLLAFIALVVIGIVKLLGNRVSQKFSDASSNLG